MRHDIPRANAVPNVCRRWAVTLEEELELQARRRRQNKRPCSRWQARRISYTSTNQPVHTPPPKKNKPIKYPKWFKNWSGLHSCFKNKFIGCCWCNVATVGERFADQAGLEMMSQRKNLSFYFGDAAAQVLCRKGVVMRNSVSLLCLSRRFLKKARYHFHSRSQP